MAVEAGNELAQRGRLGVGIEAELLARVGQLGRDGGGGAGAGRIGALVGIELYPTGFSRLQAGRVGVHGRDVRDGEGGEVGRHR